MTMERYLLCMMSLVDLSSNYCESQERRTNAQMCLYEYKQFLRYSVCTGGYDKNLEKAEQYKKRAVEYADKAQLRLEV